MSRCSICNSEHCAEIDNLVDSQSLTLKEIAQQFGVSYPALVRHCARHGKNALAPARETEISDLTAEAEKWRVRADQVWEQSVADQDTRGQVQALQAGLRSVELQHRQEQRAAEPKPENSETPCTIEKIDEIISRAMGDRRSGLIDKIFSAPESTLAAVERVLSESVS
jgi:transposase-like protein